MNETIGIFRKLQNRLPQNFLIIIYKAFAIPHLEYHDILYGQAFSLLFQPKTRIHSIEHALQ